MDDIKIFQLKDLLPNLVNEWIKKTIYFNSLKIKKNCKDWRKINFVENDIIDKCYQYDKMTISHGLAIYFDLWDEYKLRYENDSMLEKIYNKNQKRFNSEITGSYLINHFTKKINEMFSLNLKSDSLLGKIRFSDKYIDENIVVIKLLNQEYLNIIQEQLDHLNSNNFVIYLSDSEMYVTPKFIEDLSTYIYINPINDLIKAVDKIELRCYSN